MKLISALEAGGGCHGPGHRGGPGGGQGAPSVNEQTHSSKGTPPPAGRQNATIFPIPREQGPHNFMHSCTSSGQPPPLTANSHALAASARTHARTHNMHVTYKIL